MRTNVLNRLRQAFSWQPDRKIGINLAGKLIKVILLREGGPTKGWIQSAFHFGRYVETLQRSQGWRGVVVNLKGCHVLLQQVVGGQVLDNPRRLGCAIGRSRQGLPLVIPVLHRQRIQHGDIWTVKIWSSFFWLYRVLEIPGRLKISTITKPFSVNYLVILEWSRWLVQFLPVFLEFIGRREDAKAIVSKRRSILTENETSLLFNLISSNIEFIEYLTALFLPHRESDLCKKIPRKEWKTLMTPILVNLQPRVLILLNSGPNSAKGPEEGPGPNTRTSSGSILTDLLIWMTHKDLWVSIRKLWAPAAAFAQTTLAQARAVFEQMNKLDLFRVGSDLIFDEEGNFLPDDALQKTNLSELLFSRPVRNTPARLDELLREENDLLDGHEPLWSSIREDRIWGSDPLLGFSQPRGLGKLSFIPEPAGKIRVVAMVDSLTQMLLRPLHDVVFEILQKIPQDGTFDQLKPARILATKEIMTLYSYDLSAATDRFPVSLQQALLSYLIGPRVARAWREVLTSRDYAVPRWIGAKQRVPQGTPRSVRYLAGQPMGAYTSWAVFALSHHFLVQFSAYQAFGTLKWFEEYCLLGDDVVIGNKKVAESYLALLRVIGVEVGLAKSLISTRGVFEFAKRTFRITKEGLLVDLSGISLAAIAAAITDSSVMESVLQLSNTVGCREAITKAARVQGYGFRARSSLGGEIKLMNLRLQKLLIMLTRPSSAWGLPFAEWLLQVTIGVRGIISDDSTMILKDAIQQRLIATAMRLATRRREALSNWANPVDDEGKLNPIRSIPWDLKQESPLHGEFLSSMVFSKMLELASSNLGELLDDLKLWSDTKETSEGNFSLDEIYAAINRIIDGFQSLDTEVNLFIRRDTEKSESRKMSRRKSAIVKFWLSTRRMLLKRFES